MKLPDKFEEKMQALLGDEFPEVLSLTKSRDITACV